MSANAVVLGRREALWAAAFAATGLLVGCHVAPEPQVAAPAPPPPGPSPAAQPTRAVPPAFAPNAWVRVATDGTVTVIIDKSEMGQGILTGLAMLVAEELECDWSKVKTEFAPVDPAYVNPLFGMQATGGSTSTAGSWDPLRKAGAAARMMLVSAAASAWGVDAASCHAEKGEVVHAASGKRAGFGSLAEAAAKLKVPTDVPLKPRASFHLVGTRVPRLDAPAKARGQIAFGIDTQLPGMLVAVVVRPPSFAGKLAHFDAAKAQGMPGVRRVIPIDSGIAVVADGYWHARLAAREVKVEWNTPDPFSSESILAKCVELAKKPGVVAEKRGDFDAAFAKATKKIDAIYTLPFQAHATMEPMNCTADVRSGSCDIWAPTQFQEACGKGAAKITGLPSSAINVHTTYMGGGFGRRFEMDFVVEAIVLSKAMQAPVKVMWSREDDMRHDFYRPASYNVLRGGIGKNGLPVSWSHRIVSDSIMSRTFPQFMKNGLDTSAVEGATELPYDIPNTMADWHNLESGVPVGFWRSVGHSLNGFVKECFVDELAGLAKIDPLEYRRRLMTDPKAARLRATMELAAAKAGWGTPLKPGRGRGIAAHASFESFVAHVAEVTVNADGTFRVDRVVSAVDCGSVTNVDQVEAQIEGAIVYGLTAAMKSEITIGGGGAVEENFNRFDLLSMDEMPAVEVHIVPSEEKPGGCGEPGVPPIAPAVANALFVAEGGKGKRVRKLPVTTLKG
ncbi:MAG: molybdopterin cofactor-binding domain-containing protein [Polyangiaceae bacterium]